jgi:hypothetical protein
MPQTGSLRQERELGAFVRYCVNRVEQAMGEREGWVVKILHILGAGYTTTVEVDDFGSRVEATGTGPDGALSTWDAICRLEQMLRERRTFSMASTT